MNQVTFRNFCDSCACSPPDGGRYKCLKGHPIIVNGKDPETQERRRLMVRGDLKECPDFVFMGERPTRFERILNDDPVC